MNELTAKHKGNTNGRGKYTRAPLGKQQKQTRKKNLIYKSTENLMFPPRLLESINGWLTQILSVSLEPDYIEPILADSKKCLVLSKGKHKNFIIHHLLIAQYSGVNKVGWRIPVIVVIFKQRCAVSIFWPSLSQSVYLSVCMLNYFHL